MDARAQAARLAAGRTRETTDEWPLTKRRDQLRLSTT
jgi:hypothetical protein